MIIQNLEQHLIYLARIASLIIAVFLFANTAHASSLKDKCNFGHDLRVFYYNLDVKDTHQLATEITRSVHGLSKRIKRFSNYCEVTSVIVEGHASLDVSGKNAVIISRTKATELTTLLIQNGIPVELVQSVWYGNSKPFVANNSNKSFNQLDARVEVRILLGPTKNESVKPHDR